MAGRVRLRSVEACERQDWSLLLWPRAFDPLTGELPDRGEPAATRFLCGNWRCRRCATWRGAVDWARCKAAVCSRPWWLYVVLTFDPARWEGSWEAFRAGGELWDHRLRRRLERRAGRLDYLQTWEAHRGGDRWPHLNLILSGPRLRAWVEELGGVRAVSRNGREHRFPRGWRRWLAGAAPAAGFGRRVWAELLTADNPGALAGYLVKLANELTGAVLQTGGKSEQAPTGAPKGFRRIRASRGLLPSARRAGELYTGALQRCPTELPVTGRRQTKERATYLPRPWSAVVAALEEQAERAACAWSSSSCSARPFLEEAPLLL